MTYTQLDKVWEPFTTAHVGLADQGPHAEEFKEFWERVKNKVRCLSICVWYHCCCAVCGCGPKPDCIAALKALF